MNVNEVLDIPFYLLVCFVASGLKTSSRESIGDAVFRALNVADLEVEE
jgi:hypothetical protein